MIPQQVMIHDLFFFFSPVFLAMAFEGATQLILPFFFFFSPGVGTGWFCLILHRDMIPLGLLA